MFFSDLEPSVDYTLPVIYFSIFYSLLQQNIFKKMVYTCYLQFFTLLFRSTLISLWLNLSTKTCPTDVTSELHIAKKKSQFSVFHFLDLSGAFDTTDDHLLPDRLFLLGHQDTSSSCFPLTSQVSLSQCLSMTPSLLPSLRMLEPPGSVIDLFCTYTQSPVNVIHCHGFKDHPIADHSQVYICSPALPPEPQIQVANSQLNSSTWMSKVS